MKTAAENYIRPLSSGQQVFDEPSQSLQPVTLSVPKLSALQLTSGEAIFTTDIPHTPKELQGAFVLTSEGNATIVSVDPTDALVSNHLCVCRPVVYGTIYIHIV